MKTTTWYPRLLHLLCWLKVIPVLRDNKKDSSGYRFRLLSWPPLLATLWSAIPLAYYIYGLNCAQLPTTTNTTTAAATNLSETKSFSQSSMDQYIYIAFLVAVFLLILLLPSGLGHFFAQNGSAILETKFAWPQRGWMLVLSALIFLAGETTQIMFVAIHYKTRGISTGGLINIFGSNYEVLKRGVGPLIALLFCIHAPVILCFTYFVLAYAKQFSLGIIGHCGSIGWSSLTLIHTCLMAEDCYDALQDLLPTLRRQALEQADWRLSEELHQLERMSYFTMDRSTLL